MNTDEARALTLGDRVHFTGRLQRISAWPSKEWTLIPADGYGIVVGRRTYSNGHNISLGEGEGVVYVVDERFPVVLVAHALHRNVVAVPADHLDRSDGAKRSGPRNTLEYEGEALFALEDFS